MSAKDYAVDVRKYAPDCDEDVVAGLVRHFGIALQGADSALVSCSDPEERARVREGFLKKKLGRAESDAELDEAILAICERMKDTRQKSRVTFCYLLAERYGQLDLFRKTSA